MILVFILLSICIIIATLCFLILLSTFQIEIRNLEATNIKQENLDKNYAVIFSFYLGSKLKWLSFHLNDKKLRKAYSKMQLEKIDLKRLEKDFRWEDLKVIKKLQPKISNLELEMQVGLENPVTTAFLVGGLSSIISILLPYVAINRKNNCYKYTIQPIYCNQNLYKIQFNCIIQVKMVHIINVIYFLSSKRLQSNEMQPT